MSSPLQVQAAFKKFDQTGNDKLNFREFCDMMNKKSHEPAKRQESVSVTDSSSGGARTTSSDTSAESHLSPSTSQDQ